MVYWCVCTQPAGCILDLGHLFPPYTNVLCKPVVRWKGYIGSGSQVLNSVLLQVTEAFSLYSDRDRCHSLTFSRQLTCKAQYIPNCYLSIKYTVLVHPKGINIALIIYYFILNILIQYYMSAKKPSCMYQRN